MTLEGILNCPFCGEPPVTEPTGFSLRAMYIYCVNDNGCPRPKAIGETEEKAIENWNTRATHPANIVQKLIRVHRALDDALGDSDVTHIEDDGELRRQYPTQWAAEQLAKVIDEF
jgi:hypothetical protein